MLVGDLVPGDLVEADVLFEPLEAFVAFADAFASFIAFTDAFASFVDFRRRGSLWSKVSRSGVRSSMSTSLAVTMEGVSTVAKRVRATRKKALMRRFIFEKHRQQCTYYIKKNRFVRQFSRVCLKCGQFFFKKKVLN